MELRDFIFIFNNKREKQLKTIKFNKTECGVDFLLNVLPSVEVGEAYISQKFFNDLDPALQDAIKEAAI